MKRFIGIDLGTSSVKAVLISGAGIERSASRDYPVSSPRPGWSEQSPEDWYEGALSALRELLDGLDASGVEALSFSGQMHGLVMLDANDRVIRPAILWNDGRSAEQTERLNSTLGDKLLEYTGNIAFAGFTAPKLLWVKENEPENFRAAEKIMLPKDYLAYRLSGVFATDVSDASGTLYFDVANRRWSEPMLSLIGIDVSKLPRVYESNEVIGALKPELARELGLPDGVKVVIGGGDNACSAVGTGVTLPGQCNISLGTSGTVFIESERHEPVPGGAIHAFCSASGGWHYLACILSAASCRRWWLEGVLGDGYGTAGHEKYLGKNGVFFLPYLTGERSPLNDPSLRGAFLGLTPDTTREQMSLAVMEGVAFALKQNVDIIRSLGVRVERSKICGGGAKTGLWLDIIASVLGVALEVPESEQGGALGSALLAAKGVLGGDEYRALADGFTGVSRAVTPDPALVPLYEERYREFSLLRDKMTGKPCAL